MDLGIGRRRATFEEIEIAALVGLRHVLEVERSETARVMRLGRRPGRLSRREFRIADRERQLARRNVDLDQVAVANEGERTSDVRFGRDVQHAP